jgi:outer membrane protein assembly factor BamB
MSNRSRMRIFRVGMLIVAALIVVSSLTLTQSQVAHADGWSSANQLPVALQNQVALTDGSYLYIAGGANSGAKSGVYSASIGSTGSIGAWQTLPSLPMALYNHAGALQNGHAFILGGQNGAGVYSTVYSAAQQAGGTLGSWSTTTAMPQPLYDHAVASANGDIYVVGGFNASNVAQSTVYMATQTNGTLGAWTTQTPLPIAEGEIAALTVNGYLYVVGGHTGSSGVGESTVYAAPIGSNGTLGAWSSLTSLPQARWDLGIAAAGGYLWAFGGYNNSAIATATVYRAAINTGGTIGTWLAMTPLPSGVGEFTVSTAQNYFFAAGGKVGASGALSTIYTAPVAGPWLMLNSYSVTAGATVHVSGTGYASGEAVTISFNGASVATVTADSTGSFGMNGAPGASFVVPASTATGSYTVVGVGATSNHQGSATLKVTGSSTTPTPTPTSTNTPTPTATSTPTSTPTPPPTTMTDPWTTYLYDMNHRGYNSKFAAFGPSTASGISKKWSYTTGGSLVDNPAVATINNVNTSSCSSSAVPMVFVGSFSTGYLYALNATTGVVCWHTFLAKDVNPSPNSLCVTTQAIVSAPTVATVSINGVSTQVVYVGSSDITFAVNAATGQVIWHTPLAGQDIGVFSTTEIWASPTYSPTNATLYISTASFCDEVNPVDGGVYALNPATGAILAQHTMLPSNAPGGGVWGSPTVSPSQGAVFVATGNTYVNGVQACTTAQPNACAVVALNWNTLAIVQSWQIPTAQFVADGDFGDTPTLFPGAGGATWLGVGNKNGFYYVLDSANLAAGPQWSQKMANGGANPIKGIIAPTSYNPGTVTNGGVSCAGVLYLSAGNTTIAGTAYGGSVSALCSLTGQILWRQGTSGLIWAAPTLANGLVANQQGATIQVRNWSTGQVLFSYTTGHNIYGAATFANGMLYVGSTDHTLYAFGP